MSKRVCPWWAGYLLASPIRRWLLQDPHELLSPHVRSGMTVLEPGAGMGFFTLELARLVGSAGRVIAVDMQSKMIAGLKRRLGKAGLNSTVDTRVVSAESLGVSDLAGKVDFILAFAVVHEMPSSSRFFAQASEVAKPGAQLLLVEPAGHVRDAEFNSELADAARVGFQVVDRPKIRRSLAALLQKG